MSDHAWDRPGDRRWGPHPQSPTQLNVTGLAGEFGPDGMSLMALPAAAAAASAALLVQITSRSYPGGGSPFALYACNVVTDSTTPSALTYAAGSAGPSFYNLNDVDLPVGLVCWIYQSANGSWYLNDNDTRVDVVQKTGTTPDANGLYDGVLYRYNDGTHAIEARGAVKVLDISGP